MKFIKVIKADEKEQHYWEHPNYENWKEQAEVAKEKVLQDAYNNLNELYALINQKLNLSLKFDAEVEKIRGKNYLRFKSDDFSKSESLLSILFKKLTIYGVGEASVERMQDNFDEYDVSVDPKVYFWIPIYFKYYLHSGGENGIELGTAWYKDGKWIIRYEFERKKN